MNTAVISVLIPSGGGAPGFAGISACLRESDDLRLVSGDINPQAYGKQLSDAFYVMPHALEPTYIDKVKEICLKEGIQAILPITTAELPILAHYQAELLEIGVQVLVSPEWVIQKSNDKGEIHKWAKNLGLSVPSGAVCNSREAFKDLAERLLEQHTDLFFKPTAGNGSRGIGRVCKELPNLTGSNKPELMPLLLQEWLPRLPETFQNPLLLTAYLPGKEYTVDAFVWKDDEPIIVPRSRDKIVSGISVSGRFEAHKEIIAETKLLLSSLPFIGPVGVQWKEDEHGRPRLLEINPRLQGTTSALRHAGLNIPLYSVFKILGRPINSDFEIAWNKSFTRHWQDVFL